MHERAGLPALPTDLVDVDALLTAYYDRAPDPSIPEQRVAFGTSGHRGSALDGAFNEAHIAAITQAICDHRRAHGIGGPVYLARDTHALSEPAWGTALEVLVGNDVTVMIDSLDGYTPTPTLSHAVLAHNRYLAVDDPRRADGIVVTPSHNPPRDGGFKYNPPDGGPAGGDVTGPLQQAANDLLTAGLAGVRRITLDRALAGDLVERFSFLDSYVDDLPSVVDLSAIRAAGVRIGADPLGGASVDYWAAIADRFDLNLTVVNDTVDPQWPFMTLDWDGKIRMDCSSAYAMASLISRRHEFDIAPGNDADSDRHGIVTPDAGLMNPNHFLAVAIDYLLTHRAEWPSNSAVGKTVVSSSMIDRVVASRGRRLWEVPVGFKWFVPGLIDSSIVFGGEESAGASFLRRDAAVWTTDKDGIVPALLASEILAVTGTTPSMHYAELTQRFGTPAYARIDAPATREQKSRLASLSAADVSGTELAGDKIREVLTAAPGNGAAIGGIKIVTDNAWAAARPSGTEDVYKIYAESFVGPEQLAHVQAGARDIVDAALHR